MVNNQNVLHDGDATKECIKAPTNKAIREIHVDHRHHQLNANKVKAQHNKDIIYKATK